MSYLKDSKVKDFVKDAIIRKLEDMKGWNEKHYCCDLSYTLFECENINGAYFCNSKTAKEWVNKNFEYIGEIAEEIKFQFDADYANKILLDIFDNPDRFIVVIVLEVVSYLISQCKTIEKNWNDKIVFDDEIIEKLIEEVEEI